MSSQKDEKDFDQLLEKAEVHQKALNSVYKSTVQLVNEIKNRSRRYMLQVSDIEEGLVDDVKQSDESIEENIKKLALNIEKFNKSIGDYVSEFSDELCQMIEALNQAMDLHLKGKGSLTKLLKVRRTLLYLDLLIRKFKNKIVSLQLMNNALFSFSMEMKNIKDAYKSNLITINTEMTAALEHCDGIIQRIEKLS